VKRRIGRIAGAALVAGCLVAGRAHGATASPIDVSHDAITCNTVDAKIAVRPPLSFAGTASSVTFRISGKVSGCVDTTNPEVVIRSATISGTLTGVSNNCDVLSGTTPAVGKLLYRWTADPTTPIQQTASTQDVSTLTTSLFVPGTLAPGFGSARYAAFALGTGTVTGAFTGADDGALSSNIFVTNEDHAAIATLCSSAGKGVAAFHTGESAFSLQ
jgi:hypothetical protein